MKRDTLGTCFARYQVVVAIANALPDALEQLGKTAAQKSVFILQELYGLEPLYEFEFYNFGVFSKDLAFDLDSSQNMDLIEVVGSSTGYGFEIKAKITPQNPLFKQTAPPERLSESLELFINDYKNASLSRLELDSTVIFIDRDLKRRNENLSSVEFVDRTRELKPKFDVAEVKESIDRLSGRLTSLR